MSTDSPKVPWLISGATEMEPACLIPSPGDPLNSLRTQFAFATFSLTNYLVNVCVFECLLHARHHTREKMKRMGDLVPGLTKLAV